MCILEIAEFVPRYAAEPNIVEARGVVVTALDAETHRQTDDRGM